MGQNCHELVRYLISKDASVDGITFNGTSTLMSACMSESSDLRVVEMLLKKSDKEVINLRVRPRTVKWHMIYLFAKTSFISGISQSPLMKSLATRRGRTALLYAARRGDIELVEQLLNAGADHSIKDDAGNGMKEICSTFPELRGLMEKRKRKRKLWRNNASRTISRIEGFAKRISTATPIQHDMWLISLEMLLTLYGRNARGVRLDVHQDLRSRGFLVNWRDVPSDTEIIFVSHEWLSWAHPDPKGKQLKVLCHVLERLRHGTLETEMHPLHSILYGRNFRTTAKQWKEMLARTYLWIDWISMPQPGAEKEEEIGKEKMASLRERGSRAIKSIPAYVERSDFLLILVPGCYHSDRKVPTCFRTWRRRGWCLLELYAAALARDSTNPPLLIQGSNATPYWMHPESNTMAMIGGADFTCCQRNHIITTETQKVMNSKNVKTILCDKSIVGGILKQLIDAKVIHLFNVEGDTMRARLYRVWKQIWMGGLEEDCGDKIISVKYFKNTVLRWSDDDDDDWFDRDGISILAYAIMDDNKEVVRELLRELEHTIQGEAYRFHLLESRLRKNLTFGLTKDSSSLAIAMMFASPEIVNMLLQAGCDPKSDDKFGSDPFMCGALYRRVENLKIWIDHFPNWNINKKGRYTGFSALTAATWVGSHNHTQLDTLRFLIESGADVDFRTVTGGNILTVASELHDLDPKVLRFLLTTLRDLSDEDQFVDLVVNHRKSPSTLLWKTYRVLTKCAYYLGNRSGIIGLVAMNGGTTSLHQVVMRGDVENAKILLDFGADPYIKNDLGFDSFDLCEKFGPFPRVRDVLLGYGDV